MDPARVKKAHLSHALFHEDAVRPRLVSAERAALGIDGMHGVEDGGNSRSPVGKGAVAALPGSC
jgi:hypothetical protein